MPIAEHNGNRLHCHQQIQLIEYNGTRWGFDSIQCCLEKFNGHKTLLQISNKVNNYLEPMMLKDA